ncbi:DUF6725 family protein [Isoptericola sediminis]|uniref:Uncharacterized protein n=1 Tax=Isoptericola sediminis TaxID=2733572 RepID=A0A849K8A5_9MICO|nr:DUF6725 family protein [Isoptericola sediminis]NNU28269.1 hypothetical protein [Isoptericola sediminis]
MRNQHAADGPSDWRDWPVGTRAVVRRRLSPDEALTSGKRWTDVIGVVVRCDTSGITLRRDPARPSAPDAGVEVRIAAEDIEATRILPPRPERRPRSQD